MSFFDDTDAYMDQLETAVKKLKNDLKNFRDLARELTGNDHSNTPSDQLSDIILDEVSKLKSNSSQLKEIACELGLPEESSKGEIIDYLKTWKTKNNDKIKTLLEGL